MSADGTAPLESFATEARAFCRWAADESLQPVTASEALKRLTAVYLAGVQLLPGSKNYPGGDVPPIESYSRELAAIAQRIGSLRSRYYAEVFDPFESPKAEPVVGDLVDDFSDVFTDIARGLYLYDAGKAEAAASHWRFWLRSHWGEHATSAIRALHWDIAKDEG